MTALLKLSAAIDWLNQQVGRVVYWLGLVMILFGVYNTLARYFSSFFGRNLSSNAFLDIQWFLFGAMFLLGAGYGLRHNVHVRVDVFAGRLGTRGRTWVELFALLLILLPFCAMQLWFSLDWVGQSLRIWEGSPNPGGLPLWPAKLIVPAAFALLMLQGVSQVIKCVAALRGRGVPLFDDEEQSEVAV